jgi:hypothetical protein
MTLSDEALRSLAGLFENVPVYFVSELLDGAHPWGLSIARAQARQCATCGGTGTVDL